MDKNVGNIAEDQIEDLEDGLDLEGGGEEEGADAGSQGDDTGESDEIKKLRKQAEESGAAAEKYREENERLKGQNKVAIDARFEAAESALNAHERENITSIQSMKDSIKELQEKKKEALNSGDNDSVVDIDDKIMEKKLDLRGLENQKSQIADAKVKLTTIKENALKAPEQSKQTNAEAELTPAAKAWVDKNPRFNTDAEYQAEAIGAHEVAVRKGIKVDSPAYFKFIEDRLAKAFPEEDDGSDDAGEGDESPEPKKKPVKNPQSFGASGSSGQNPGGTTRKKIGNLTAAEVEAAEMSGMTNKEYWDYKYGPNAPKKEA